MYHNVGVVSRSMTCKSYILISLPALLLPKLGEGGGGGE